MNGLDIFLVLALIAAAAVGFMRGLGRVLIDALLVYAALWGASQAYLPLSRALASGPDAASNQATMFCISFVVLGGAALALSHFVHESMPLYFGMMDKVFGIAGGIALGLIISHGIVRAIALNDQRSDEPTTVTSRSIGSELLDFKNYHAFIDSLYAMTGGQSRTASAK